MWKYKAMKETGFTLGILSGDFVRIAVTGRSYPSSLDYWDGNWLTSTITVQAGVWRGEYSADLRADEFPPFLAALLKMYETLSGEAEFVPMEPWLKLKCKAERSGIIRIFGEASASIGDGNILQFDTTIDQTFLPPVIESLKHIVTSYPVVGE